MSKVVFSGLLIKIERAENEGLDPSWLGLHLGLPGFLPQISPKRTKIIVLGPVKLCAS